MKNYKLVIFDVDGILFNTEHIFRDVFEETGRKYRHPRLNEELFQRTTGISGKDTEKLFQSVFPESARPLDILYEIRALGKQRINEQLALLPGAEEIMRFLDERSIPFAAATATVRALTEERFQKMNILDRFVFILCGDEVKRKKPDPEIYETVMERMDVLPEQTLVFEDTGYGVRAASAAGADCILIPSVTDPSPKERGLALYVAEDFYDVIRYLENAF